MDLKGRGRRCDGRQRRARATHCHALAKEGAHIGPTLPFRPPLPTPPAEGVPSPVPRLRQ